MFSFINNNNDCYLNSVIQALLNTYSFISLFEYGKYENNIILLLKNIYISKSVINPNKLKKKLASFDKQSFNIFGNSEQQDAHEAIIKIIDIVHLSTLCNEFNYNEYGIIDNELKRKSFDSWKNNANIFGYSFITKFFTGQFKTTIKCNKCTYKNISFDNFNNINLPIFGENLVDCLLEFIKPENISEAVCEKCNNNTLIKTTTIYKFPLTLILNLKRFKYDSHGNISKIKKSIKIDNNLLIKNNKLYYNYSISSVIYHHGSSPNMGHYNVDIFKNELCYFIDDDKIYKRKNFDNINNNCYILIYNLIT